LGCIKIYVKINDMQFLNERVSAIRIGGRSAVLAKCAVKTRLSGGYNLWYYGDSSAYLMNYCAPN